LGEGWVTINLSANLEQGLINCLHPMHPLATLPYFGICGLNVDYSTDFWEQVKRLSLTKSTPGFNPIDLRMGQFGNGSRGMSN
jgi:hypothetical protein